MKLISLNIRSASRQNSTNVGNFNIELGALYDSRDVHLSFRTIFLFLSIYFAKLWYDSLLWTRDVRKMYLTEIGSKV